MAITPSNWGRRVELVGSVPSSTLTDHVLLITEDSLPSEIWSLAENGGGDLRVCTDSDGVNQLPLEVVKFDTLAEQAVLWVKFTSYGTSATSLWLFYNKASETQPSVTATYGRNAVWSDFEYACHFSTGSYLVDSSGNHSLTDIGTTTEVSDNLGDGGVYSSNVFANRLTVTGYTGIAGNAARTHNFWFKTTRTDTGFLDYGTNSSGKRITVRVDSNNLRLEVNGGYRRTSGFTINDGDWHRGTVKLLEVDGSLSSDVVMAIDGVESSSYTTAGSPTLNTTLSGDVNFANYVSNNRATEYLGEHWLRAFAISSDRESSEYSNQSDNGSFWTVGTPESIVEVSEETIEFSSSLDLSIGSIAAYSPFKEISSSFNTSISYTSSLALIKEVKGTQDLSIDATSNLEGIKFLESALETSIANSSILYKVSSFTTPQYLGVDVTGNFSVNEEGLLEFYANLNTLISSTGSFTKVSNLEGTLNTSMGISDSIYTIKNFIGDSSINSDLVGSIDTIKNLEAPLNLLTEVSSNFIKYSSLNSSISLGLSAKGIVYNALNDLERVSSVVASINGHVVKQELSGILESTSIEGHVKVTSIIATIKSN